MFLHTNSFPVKFWLLFSTYTCATISAIFILWLLRYIVWSIFSIDLREEIWLYILPIITTAILWYIVVYSKSKIILGYDMGRVLSFFKYTLSFLMAVIIYCSQEYFSETLFKHHTIYNVQGIDINDKKIRYYTIDELKSNTTQIGELVKVNRSLSSRARAYYLELFFAAIIDIDKNGVTYWNTSVFNSGDKPKSYIKSDQRRKEQSEYRSQFINKKQYSNTTFKRIFSSHKFDIFQDMLKKQFPRIDSSKIVLLQAVDNNRTNYLKWGLIAFSISIFFMAIVSLFTPLNRHEYDMQSRQSIRKKQRNKLFRIVFQFIYTYTFLSLIIAYIVGINIAIITSNSSYIYSYLLPEKMLYWGAMTSNLVFNGEWWRLITSLFATKDPLATVFHLCYFAAIYIYLQKNMGVFKTILMFILSAIIINLVWIFTASPNLILNGFYALTLALSGGTLCILFRAGVKGGIDLMPILSILVIIVCFILDITAGTEFVYYIIAYITMVVCGSLLIKKKVCDL